MRGNFIIIAIIAFIVFVLSAFLYDVFHPCTAYGPPRDSFVMMNCGDGCWMMVPTTTRECVERR